VATTAHWAIEGYNSDMGALFLGEQTQHARGDGSAAMGRGPRREHVTGEGGRTTCCKRRGRASRLLVAAAEKEPGRLRCSAGGMSTEGIGRVGNLVPVRVRVRVPVRADVSSSLGFSFTLTLTSTHLSPRDPGLTEADARGQSEAPT
jgi:hypothetical protein